MLQYMSPLMALSGQSSCAHVCPLLGQSGQIWILACDGLSAYDPQATFGVEGADQQDGPQRRTRHRADEARKSARTCSLSVANADLEILLGHLSAPF